MTTQAPDTNTALAVERTRLAYERTLMAWIRTSASLISFGFTIYKFFDFMRESRGEHRTEMTIGPTAFASVLIVTGIISLILAWLQHHLQMKAMRGQFGKMPYSLAGVTAALIGALGLLALLLIGLHL